MDDVFVDVEQLDHSSERNPLELVVVRIHLVLELVAVCESLAAQMQELVVFVSVIVVPVGIDANNVRDILDVELEFQVAAADVVVVDVRTVFGIDWNVQAAAVNCC